MKEKRKNPNRNADIAARNGEVGGSIFCFAKGARPNRSARSGYAKISGSKKVLVPFGMKIQDLLLPTP